MSGNFKFDHIHHVKVVPRGGKSTDRDQNRISSEGGQNITGHSFRIHCPGNARKSQIWPVSLSQNRVKSRKSTDCGHNLISSGYMVARIHQHAKYQAIRNMLPQGNARKPQTWPVSLSQNKAKIRKINGQISDHSFDAFFGKARKTADGRRDGRTEKLPGLAG